MGWLDKLFGKDEPPVVPAATASADGNYRQGIEAIRFGRYSDNNKSLERTRNWYVADDAFKAGKYAESFKALFKYIEDETEQNLEFKADGDQFSFTLIQGSKKVYGQCDGTQITARSSIAVMEQPSNAVMRRLLELNFSLFYARCALDEQQALCIIWDAPIVLASPSRVYYALREMATLADRQDDLMVADFETLKPIDTGHITALPAKEIDVKYAYFRKWIEETIAKSDTLNADAFSGAIAYLYLDLLYRIDFLIVPEAKLMADLEAISRMYWFKKDEVTIVERNAMMKTGIRKLLDITEERFADGLYRSKGTFAATSPPAIEKMRENVQSANKDTSWYLDNKHADLALIISEYGMLFNQFSFSMPAVLTQLTVIFTEVLHPQFFSELGLTYPLILPANGQPDQSRIVKAVDSVIDKWTEKYQSLKWDHSKIRYISVSDFAYSFSEQLVSLNLEVKR